MIRIIYLALFGGILSLSACFKTGHSYEVVVPGEAVIQSDSIPVDEDRSLKSGRKVDQVLNPTPVDEVTRLVEPSTENLRVAKLKYKKAHHFYVLGQYQKAETLLSESISIYPFMPIANVLLGKIYLIRGAANKNHSLLNNARLMFQMAYAMDPNLEEAKLLLELYQSKLTD